MDKELAQFTDMYIASVKEYVQLLSDSLLKIEKDMGDKTAIEDAFRASHSIKGESAAMDFSRLAYLAHTVEDVLYEVKKERMQLTPEIADCLFEALDVLGRSVESIEASGEDLDVKAEVARLKQLTGVKTEGVGKSAHGGLPASSSAANGNPPLRGAVAPPAVERIRTVSVKVEQLDSLMNLFEELLVHRLTLGRLVQVIGNQELADYHHQVEKIVQALQFEILKIRAVPLKIVFDHYPRAVRDLARQTGKDISLEVEGSDLELDRTIVERLDEPLTHLIRNSVSHGIAESGVIRVAARREQDFALIEVADNGEGVDWQAVAQKAGVSNADPATLKSLLFSGLSTAKTITEVSGRGVGLRAVKQSIEELGGSIDVASGLELSGELGLSGNPGSGPSGKPGSSGNPGSGSGRSGTTFTIKLPLSLAVMKALLVRVGEEQYAIPVGAVDRSVKVAVTALATTAGQEAFVLEESEVPLLRLRDRFHAVFSPVTPAQSVVSPSESVMEAITPGAALAASLSLNTPAAPADPDEDEIVAVVVVAGEERLGLVVDEVVETADMIVKPVPEILQGNRAFGGTTILGDGRSALILNVGGLV